MVVAPEYVCIGIGEQLEIMPKLVISGIEMLKALVDSAQRRGRVQHGVPVPAWRNMRNGLRFNLDRSHERINIMVLLED